MKPALHIYGSNGQLPIDNQGIVLGYSQCTNDEYKGITKIDLQEYMTYWGLSQVPSEDIDILNVGYWENGEYIKPCNGWREDLKEIWADQAVFL